ncbi:MAG: sigma-70 family RNA polymerase sigma factor [Phaeodactylibacter sp.]|nr:sigma-70 family RNA polymerase sigma factor [Phaeodactylibacter sp.]
MNMIKATHPDDQTLLEQLLQADRKAIDQVYQQILPTVIQWIKDNSGTEQDARDIFQEALIALYKKLEAGNFSLTCRLKSFMRIICRNLWLTRLRDRRHHPVTPLENCEAYELDKGTQQLVEQSEETQLYYKYFDALDEKCRQILQWFFDRCSFAEIAERLDTSEQYVRKRKFICKERLISQIQADPIYLELRNA